MPGYPKNACCNDRTYGNLKEYFGVNIIQEKKKQAEQKNKNSFIQKDVEHFIIVLHRIAAVLKIHIGHTFFKV
jgi:ribosomal protein S19